MDEKWPEVCSSVPAHRRGFAGSPRLEPRTSFLELCQGELRRKRLPRTRVNKGKSKGDTRKGQSALGLDPPLTHSAPSPAGLVQTTTRHECVLPSPLIDLHPASASTCAGRVRVPGLGASCPRTQGADANARCRGGFQTAPLHGVPYGIVVLREELPYRYVRRDVLAVGFLTVRYSLRKPVGGLLACAPVDAASLSAYPEPRFPSSALSGRKPGFESRWGHYPACFWAGCFYSRRRAANPAPTAAPASVWDRVCALRVTRDQSTSGNTRRKTKPKGPSSRGPAAAACPATVQWALAFQSSVIPATPALARPIEKVSKVRFCGASSSTRAASRVTKAASRNTAGVRRSARTEIQKSPTRERRRIKSTYPATAAPAVNSTAR